MKNGSSLKTVSLSFSLYIFSISRDWGIECIICAIRSRKSEEELMATHILLELGKIFFHKVHKNKPIVIIALTKDFDRTVPLKIIFPFPWIPYLKTCGKSLPVLFLVKNFEEKE